MLMNASRGWLMAGDNPERVKLMLLICSHIIVCCVSLVYLSPLQPMFHIIYDPIRLYGAVVVVIGFAVVGYLLALAEFSFGYFVGFYLYTMVLGYLWLNYFSDLDYDHRLSGLSAAASAIAFLLPALFIVSPIRQIYAMTATAFDRLLAYILVLAAATIAVGAAYNFRLVSLEHIYDFRDKLESPAIPSYLIGMANGALLPFAFAAFAARKAYWRAGAVLVLLLFVYPITLSKLALFTPFWLVAMLLLSKVAEARIAVVLSLFLPVLAGVLLISLFREHAMAYFSLVNFRLVAVPSNAMDVYSEFFSNHDLTYFCQISFLKPMVNCPYQDPLSIVMLRAYSLGNLNASLFATEGIASVGPLFAPISVFVCGLAIALGNRCSAGLPSGFVLISGAILPQVLLNVPLTTVFLTHGAGILFLLWYITPRAIFEQKAIEQTVCETTKGLQCRTF
jgi:hypothetical protein